VSTTETAETTPAATVAPKFCAECGEVLASPSPVPVCPGCMDWDTAVALAKLHHQMALDILRGKDRAAVVTARRGALAAAGKELGTAREALPGLEAAAREAITAARLAQDRARDAVSYATSCAEDERRAQRDKAGPERQTGALTTARAAADVAQRERAAAEGAAAAAKSAEGALGEDRQRAAALEDAEVTARLAAGNVPATVAMSERTLFCAHPMLALAQPGITEHERTILSIQVQMEANLCGLSRVLRAEGHAEGRKEAEEAAARRPVLVPTGDGMSATTISPIRPR
jgi:hypothetical protein